MNNSYDTTQEIDSLAPQRALTCPHCPQHFYTKSGCTRHIQAKHQAADNAASYPSPVPTPLPQYFHRSSLTQSPDPSDLSFPPSQGWEFNTNSPDLDFTLSLSPLPSHKTFNTDPPNLNMDNIFNVTMPSSPHFHNSEEFQNTDSSCITQAFHPKLYGTSICVVC